MLLAGHGASTRIVYHALRERFGSETSLEVILEENVSKTHLLKRRLRKLGPLPILGQVLFMTVIVPILRARGHQRVETINVEHRLNDAPIPEPIHQVASANSAEARALLGKLEPDVVVVNGTRILSAQTLASTPAPFLNMHAGITPAYRGVHGGYWALAEGRPDQVGTTIHLIDEGIDTGGIIEQVHFDPSPSDTFWTYPYLHTAAGCPALLRAVGIALSGGVLTPKAPLEMRSLLRYHPTLWGYVRSGLARGAW